MIEGPTVFEKVQVPENLLDKCPEPDLDSLETNGDIETALVETTASLVSCNEDKADIRAWGEE